MVHGQSHALDPQTLPRDIAAVVRRSSTGDRQAIAELIGRYQGRVARFVISQTGDRNLCEDLCQTIFVKMVLGLSRLKSFERFEPWLFQIARNVCRDHLRQRRGWRKLFVPYEPMHEAIASAEPAATEHDERKLERGIEQLPASQRNLLRLCMDGKSSYEELARLTNLSLSAVKSRLHRARENLRGILAMEESE